MKIILTALALSFIASSASAGMSYECWTYKGGSPDKMVKVTASSKTDAVSLARAKFLKLGIKPSSVKCK